MTFSNEQRGRARTWIRNHIVGFVAIVLAMSGGAYAASTVKKKQFNKLKARVTALEARPAPAIPTIPASLPPSGPAGGDLTGNYPNPDIAPGVIPTTLPPSGPAGGDLTGNYPNPSIATGVVGSNELQDGGVDAEDIGNVIQRASAPVTVGGGEAHNGFYNTGDAFVSCEPGEELVSAHGTWSGIQTGQNDLELWISEVLTDDDTDLAIVTGGNDSGSDFGIIAVAMCLQA